MRRAVRQGNRVEPGAAALLKKLWPTGVKIAVASSSKNCSAILSSAKLDRLIDLEVDGVDLEKLELPGKPRAKS